MSAEEFAGLGFAPGTVKGVRSFDVDKFGRLTGIHFKQVWVPGENAAECRKRDDPYWMAMQQVSQAIASYTADSYGGFFRARRVPHESLPTVHMLESCECGFYGYFDGSDDYHDNGRVTGVVEAYGETVIGTRGFRAMKARIVALRVAGEDLSPAMGRKVTRNYAGVPVFDDFERMVAEFPPDTSLEPSPETDPEFWTRALP